MLHAEVCAVLLGTLHGALKNASRSGQLQLSNRRQNIFVLEMRLKGSLFRIVVFDFSVDTSFRLIINPFTDEKLVLVMIEVRALAFTRIMNPMTFKMITITLSKHTVTVALALMPLTFINTLIVVDHTAFTLR